MRVPYTVGRIQRSMYGVTALPRRMAYITPSGRPPQTRITTTSRPISAPYTQQPSEVNGEPTMSVAMKTAPSMSPPEKSMKMGEANRSESARWSAPLRMMTAAKMDAGMRQFIMLRATR